MTDPNAEPFFVDIAPLRARVHVRFRSRGTTHLDLSWREADELAHCLRRNAAFAKGNQTSGLLQAWTDVENPVRGSSVWAEGTTVRALLLGVDGRQVLHVQADVAMQLHRGLIAAARLAEEYEKRADIAMDSAILARAGAPFLLSDRQDVRDAALHEAIWNDRLRKIQPLVGIESAEQFGELKILQGPPPERN